MKMRLYREIVAPFVQKIAHLADPPVVCINGIESPTDARSMRLPYAATWQNRRPLRAKNRPPFS